MKKITHIPRCDMIRVAFRASGPGGQHRNKVASAIRLTHKPTGIRVEAREERKQGQNYKVAYQRLLDAINKQLSGLSDAQRQSLYNDKSDTSFGSQDRTYRLGKDAGVIDHRTGVETRDARGVLDGEIDEFIRAQMIGGIE
jgi:peptide chain release factor 2